MSNSPIRVLIVDDEESLRVPLAQWLAEEHGYVAETAASGLEALEVLEAQDSFDVLLLDHILPAPYNGIELMEEIKERYPDSPMGFIVFTDWGLDPQVGIEALKSGAYRYLAKPFNREELAILIQSMVETRRTREKLEHTFREKAFLESLLEVSQSINSSLELDELLQLILDEMKRVLVYDSASIQRITDAGLQVVACQGFSNPGELMGYVFPPSETYPNYRVWQSKQPLIVEDMHLSYQARHVRGWLGVPLICRGEAIGVITLDSQSPGFYDEDDAQTAMVFANQAAIAVENAGLHQQTRERADALRRLLEVGQQIARVTVSPRGVLETIARMACQVTDADCAVIYPYIAGSQIYDKNNVAGFGLRHDFIPSDKPREYGKSVAARIIREPGGICVLSDVTQDTERTSQGKSLQESPFIVREEIQAFVGIRLNFGAEPVGILFVSYRHPHQFTEDEMEIIQLFANQAAVAIWNARLYGRTNEKLEKKVGELQTVSEISQVITSTLDLNEVLSLILGKAMELVDAKNGVLQLVEDDTGELAIQLRKDPLPITLDQPRLKLGEGVTGKAAQEKRSIIVHDVTQPPWRDIYYQLWPDTRSELAMPLLIGEQCIGVLNLEHPEPGYFSEDERELIEGLAAQAAIAIQNARRYDELERTKGDLAATEAVAWMGLFGSSWAHAVTQKTSAIRNYLAVLTDYVPQNSKAQDVLGMIEEAVKAIQGIPIVQQLPPDPRTATAVDLDAALRSQVQRWCRSRPEIELVFDLKCDGIRTHMDRDWLDVAMEKLVNNALKAMPDSGRLEVSSRYQSKSVEVKITDVGCGIPDRVRSYFLKDRIPQNITDSGSTGIGALIARYIFRAFGGDLELLWSEPGQGTTLCITLPATPIQALKNTQGAQVTQEAQSARTSAGRS